jgi:hypothetical protein
MIAMNLMLQKEEKMKLIETTYRTFSGTKTVIEIAKRKPTQWIINENDQPKFYVDLYDLSIESNAMMNSLVLCAKKSIRDVLEAINQKNNINLSITKVSKLGIKKKLKSVPKSINLEPLPEKWLSYSL